MGDLPQDSQKQLIHIRIMAVSHVQMKSSRRGVSIKVFHRKDPKVTVTRKYLMELVDGWTTWPMKSVRVESPRFRQNQVEGAAFCPRTLVRVEGGGRMGFYVAMGFTCADATKMVRAGKTLKVMETVNGKEIVAV